MTHETIPTQIDAYQQQFVKASLPNGMCADPGEWVVKWPDGRIEVFADSVFHAKFRVPHRCPTWRADPPKKWPCPGIPPWDRPVVTFGDSPGIAGGVNPERRPNGY